MQVFMLYSHFMLWLL